MPRNRAMKAALHSLMSELGGMNMDRARKRKTPPPDSNMGTKRDAELSDDDLPVYRGESAKRRRRVRMGDPDMDD